ncbi:TetR/AcrR family transcriptional regulator [Streptomyces sp. NPDC005485]|uniref:TetR/AcrR family transcriptional regulator n=1 Tax=Streptomyces sp. NPDC005485 TaxID=3155591 RepID=UPI0033A627EE
MFTAQGINATGMDQLSTAADVSKRTLYVHFPSKDELIGAYLKSLMDDLLPVPQSPDDSTSSPRDRLLAVFDWARPETIDPFRGCPFLNVSVEVPDPGHPPINCPRRTRGSPPVGLRTSRGTAGPPIRKVLGEQLALLFVGAAARGTGVNSTHTAGCARSIAEVLVDAALVARPGQLSR